MTVESKATGIEVEAPVRRVTVMEDRAQVLRRARLRLEPGRHVLSVFRVSPLLVDRSLRGGLEGPGGRLVDLGVERVSTVAATRPELQQELREQLDRLKRDRVAGQHRLELARAEQKGLRQVRGFALQHICQQAGRGLEQAPAWRQSLGELDGKLDRAEEELARMEHADEDLEERMRRLGDRLWAAMQPTVHYWATLRAALEIETAGEYEVGWEYLVPCALWRPAHQAELPGEEGVLRWTTLGTVWQNTGEAWDDVELRLSTERPTLGAELPLLEEDRLHLRPKSDEEKQTIQVSSRDEAIEAISPGLDAEAHVSVVPGVDDGGEVRVFELPHPVTIPSDGRAHLVPLDHFESEARLDLVCFPEATDAVLLRSQQSNTGGRPLLAGPVRLVQNGGFTGRGQIPFVAPGEAFALGWGSQDELQVVRRTGQRSEEKTLGRRVCHTIWTRVYLSNTGTEPRRVTVTERVPVSEVEEVQVKVVSKETTAGYRETPEGHLVWEIELQPRGQHELELTYEVDAHRKVVWR
jgi:uncharacterized protein (TIGR02231 family)